MDIILADSNRIEQGFLLSAYTMDIENNSSSTQPNFDFEITLSAEDVNYKGIDYGTYMFVPGTEYGGRFGHLRATTQESMAAWEGYTWRGMLDKKIIQPAAGQDYKTVTGDANTILKDLIGDMTPLFVVPDTDSGIMVTNFQFDRYTTVRKGMEKMLRQYGGKLHIHAEQGAENEPFYVVVECVKAQNYSTEIEYSQDSDFAFEIENKRNGINHLICLGSGELKDRQVVHLYADAQGNISKTQSFFGVDEITEIYDFSAAESLEDLENYGIERFREVMNRKKFSVDITDGTEYDIGDIIAGQDFTAGMKITAPVTGKIFRMDEYGAESVEYMLEVDE